MEPKLFMRMDFSAYVYFGWSAFCRQVWPSKLINSAITMAQTTIADITETNLSFV